MANIAPDVALKSDTAEDIEAADPANQTDRAVINAYEELASIRQVAQRLNCTNHKVYSTLKRYNIRMQPAGFQKGKNPTIEAIEQVFPSRAPAYAPARPGTPAPKESLKLKEELKELKDKEKAMFTHREKESESTESGEREISHIHSKAQLCLIDEVITKGLRRIKKELPNMKPTELNTIVSNMLGKKIELTKVNLDIVQTSVIKKLFGSVKDMRAKLEEIRETGDREAPRGPP